MEAFTIELPADAGSPGVARRAVAERLGGRPRLDDLLLCVSEVVTNAVLHARTPATFTLRLDGDVARVELADQDPTLPLRRAHDLMAPTGRGLRLLDDLARAWGASADGRGKVVWFELDLGDGE